MSDRNVPECTEEAACVCYIANESNISFKMMNIVFLLTKVQNLSFNQFLIQVQEILSITVFAVRSSVLCDPSKTDKLLFCLPSCEYILLYNAHCTLRKPYLYGMLSLPYLNRRLCKSVVFVVL